MILLTIKAHLTRKVLWNFEPNYQQKPERVETKNQEVLQALSNRGSYFFGRIRTCSILQQWCNSPSVSLPTKAFAEMLDCVEALDHVCL
jgi:hypothetical protein